MLVDATSGSAVSAHDPVDGSSRPRSSGSRSARGRVCAMRGFCRSFQELDESGARADRPLPARALERVEAGHTRGLVVARLDRVGRSLVDSLAAIERIHRAGGVFVSVQDGLDLTTDTARMVLRVMLSMAEWELDRIRGAWDAARERAVARGVHLSPRPPTGYRRSSAGRLIAREPDASVVAEVFRRRAAGESISALCRALEAAGVVTPYDNQHWRYTSLRGVLRNRVYLGEARSGTFVCEGAHPALVDEVTWRQAQRPRQLASVRASVPSPLAGLVRCAGSRCDERVPRKRRPRRPPRRQYACGRHSAGGACPAPASISANQLEPFVEDAMFELLSRRGPPRTRRANDRAGDAGGGQTRARELPRQDGAPTDAGRRRLQGRARGAPRPRRAGAHRARGRAKPPSDWRSSHARRA